MTDHTTRLRLLGFCPESGFEALRAALTDSAGPALHLIVIAGLGVAAQVEKEGGLFRTMDRTALLRRLHAVQRRLELACQAGPFLPADPAAPPIKRGELPRLVGAAARRLLPALARDGAKQQWEITMRWPPEVVLAPHRAALATAAVTGTAAVVDLVGRLLRQDRDDRLAALRGVLSPRVVALTEGQATDTEISLTLLVQAGGEAAIEAALDRLPPAVTAHAAADLRGPLPPVSFAACALVEVPVGEITAAWHRLELNGTIDAAGLRRIWRSRASAVHPDHTGNAADAVVLDAARTAYRLLAPLIDEAGPCGLPALRGLAGRRLVPAAAPGPEPDAIPTPVSELAA